MTETSGETPKNTETPPVQDAGQENNAISGPKDHKRNSTEPDAQAMVISSLRSQIQDLFSQVTQLNNKLVQSYDRVSDLEDNLHVASSNIRSSSIKISQLELERTQHLSALNTGLLVEKSHVTAELNRLMEKATEEAAQRGQAESARADIEKDLDDLSASLFGQANTMVAEARYARALSEQKVDESERALKGAEEAVSLMQRQMQALKEEKEKAEKAVEEMQVSMGKGKWVERAGEQSANLTSTLRLMSSHAPYQEFLIFVAHLRSLHPASPQPPAMSTLLPTPFLARLLTEDSEPTVRLDLAPSLNWLSRRSVLAAIHNGQLTIEPMSSTTLLQELAPTYSTATIAAQMISSSANANVSCALCGTSIFAPPQASSSQPTQKPPSHPLSLSRTNSGYSSTMSWSPSSLLKNTLSYSASNSAPNSPPPSPSRQTHSGSFRPLQVYIFRVSSPATAAGLPVSQPISSSTSSSGGSSSQIAHATQSQTSTPNRSSPSTIYPLCVNGWCLSRLRTTCTLWAYVRTGIVDKVWDEEIPVVVPPPVPPRAREARAAAAAGKPPIPPRRRTLWGMASALSEKAASWTDGEKDRSKEKDNRSKTLPSPPPSHPQLSKTATSVVAPPPLPKRSEVRSKNPTRESSPLTLSRKPMPAINGTNATSEKKPEVAPVVSQDGPAAVTDAPPVVNAVSETTAEKLPQPTPVTSQNPTEAGATSEAQSAVADDVFTTPTDEMPPDPPSIASSLPEFARSPAKIPLPLSPPGTPTLASTIAARAELSSRPGTPTGAAVTRGDAPARTASPAPPPLPRRAAARGPRPQPPPPPELPPRAAAPAATEVTGSAISEPAAAELEAPTAPEVLAPENAAPAPSDAAEGDAVPALSLAVPEEPTMAPSAVPDTLETTAETPSEILAEPRAIKHVNDPITNGEQDKKRKDTEEVITANGADANQADTDKEEDKEVYVGDASWEERTWKELVKLREAMFYARIGGVR